MPESDFSTEEILSVLSRLLQDYKLTDEDLARITSAGERYPELAETIGTILELREVTSRLSKGKLDEEIPSNGFIISNLKALQSKLNHLSWQMTQVSKGDFTQRVDFMGEFSESFNAMCHELESQKSTLTELAQHDGLTKLANRQYLDTYLKDLFERAKATGHGFSLIMLDIDFFKKVNDAYGHDVGDLVLAGTAQYLRKVFRSTDFIARYGGEEFLVALTQASREQTLVICERVLEYFNTHPIVINEELNIPITVSMGVSRYASTDESWEQIVKRSDNALYLAKSKGRNRVETL